MDVIEKIKSLLVQPSASGWRGCELVNPLCPSDLCTRHAGHQGDHRLGTMAEPMPTWLPTAPNLGNYRWTETELVELGRWLQGFMDQFTEPGLQA